MKVIKFTEYIIENYIMNNKDYKLKILLNSSNRKPIILQGDVEKIKESIDNVSKELNKTVYNTVLKEGTISMSDISLDDDIYVCDKIDRMYYQRLTTYLGNKTLIIVNGLDNIKRASQTEFKIMYM